LLNWIDIVKDENNGKILKVTGLLGSAIQKKLEGYSPSVTPTTNDNDEMPKPILPLIIKNEVLALDSEEIARQITLQDWEIFR